MKHLIEVFDHGVRIGYISLQSDGRSCVTQTSYGATHMSLAEAWLVLRLHIGAPRAYYLERPIPDYNLFIVEASE